MSSVQMLMVALALFVKFVYEVCITIYAESYILPYRSTVFFSVLRARQGKMLTLSYNNQEMVNTFPGQPDVGGQLSSVWTFS